MRSRRTLALLGALFTATLSLAAGPAPLAKAVVLSGKDMLALPGSTVTLAAKLERDGWGEARTNEEGLAIWRRDIEGATLHFSYQGADLGSAVTDDDGYAYLDWTPPGPGDHEIDVRFAGTEKFEPGEGSLMCGVRSTDRPAIVLDIDHTLSTASKWQVIRQKIDAPPLADSVAVVHELAEDHDIFYMTARIKKFQRYTRAWLEHHGFPRYPIFFMDYKKYPTYDEAQYKIDTLEPLTEMFPNLQTGVGDKKSDAEAYRHHGLRALILGDTGGVQGAEPVDSWSVIRGLLLSDEVEKFGRLHTAIP